MNRKLILISFLLFTVTFNVVAQNFNITNERTFSSLFNQNIDTLENFHTSIRPFYKNEIGNHDSLMGLLDIKSESKFVSAIFNYGKVTAYEKKIAFELSPIINAGIMMEKSELVSQSLPELAVGLSLDGNVGKKWSSQFVFLADYSKYPSHVDAMVQSKNISPGYGYSKDGKAFYGQGNITFTADENFTFQLGYGKNFIGDGYRSLFLSDHANSYPYLKVTANIWKLKYMALYTNYQDIRGSDGNMKDYFQKLSTVHYLSLNIAKWWNIGLFESIIWQSQEDDFYRGYDINYFNPVLFLRPTEYSQGSSDNALLGGSMKFKIRKKNILYGQLILDEFKLNELQAGTGWWANKYGYQFGFKSYDFLWVKNLSLQLEYNMVRPFTYSHSYTPTSISTLQNYAHFNSPLAHPLGANFNEAVAGLTYHKKRWIIEGLATSAKIGLDTSSTTSVGQDVYISNQNRPLDDNGKVIDYGYFTTQGLTTDIINSTLKISYVINPKSQLIFQVGVTNRTYKNSIETSSTNMFFVGIKTSITNRYFDF
ncbi:MAG: hypothetical protein JKX68_13165 [Flavobacteriales bacterium]|nr:hypothetical protein [Flavobacteriales bacterium]